jgi:hypothetical protein
MPEATSPERLPAVEPRPRLRAVLLVLLGYAICVAASTYPRVLTLGSRLPAVADPVTHLWTLRWYRTCLLEGRSVFHLPGIQAPVGAPLGLVPPMHFQALLYVPLSLLIPNDVLCYNLIWIVEFLMTGLGTFLLCRHVVRSVPCAFVGGLLAMISGPMMMHAHGHLELMALGAFPLFVLSWMRFIERPGRGSLAAAVLLYWLVVMSAAYFAVLAVIPAVCYVCGAAWNAAKARDRPWFGRRLAWLAAFVALGLPGVLLLFSSQVWAALHGQTMTRPRAEFVAYGAPLWGYAVPTSHHLISRLIPKDPYDAGKIPIVECASYLGLATLGLIAYAAACRVPFARRRFWWFTLGFLVILSCGATWRIAGHRVELPGAWLWKHVIAFRMIRVPARFNLLAAVFAAVVASAALRHLLGRIGRPSRRGAVLAGVVVLSVADLGMVPFGSVPLPEMPACYRFLRRRDPGALYVEIPQFPSAAASALNAMAAYWQSFHGGRTTAGYGAHPNERFDDLIGLTTPFDAYALLNPHHITDTDLGRVTITNRVWIADYTWLFLKAFDIRYVIYHKWDDARSGLPLHLDALRAMLAPARIYEDAQTIVYDRDKLPPPTRPTVLCTEGWRRAFIWKGKLSRVVGRNGSLLIYSPGPGEAITLQVEAAALHHRRTVRLATEDRELARWEVSADVLTSQTSPPFRLAQGIHAITIESDREERPRNSRESPIEGDRRPYSLRVTEVRVQSQPAIAAGDEPAPRR